MELKHDPPSRFNFFVFSRIRIDSRNRKVRKRRILVKCLSFIEKDGMFALGVVFSYGRLFGLLFCVVEEILVVEWNILFTFFFLNACKSFSITRGIKGRKRFWFFRVLFRSSKTEVIALIQKITVLNTRKV